MQIDPREVAIIGCCILNPDNFKKVYQFGNIFVNEICSEIYEIIASRFKDNKLTDLITLTNHILTNTGHVSILEVNQFVDASINAAFFDTYLSDLLEDRAKRNITFLLKRVRELNSDELTQKIQNELSVILRDKDKRIEHVKEILVRLLSQTAPPKIKTGFSWIDSNTGGFAKQELVIMAARPGIGKTTLALNMIRNMLTEDTKVGLFSAEMKSDVLVRKMISSACIVHDRRIEIRELNKIEEMKVAEKMDFFVNKSFYIDDTPAINIDLLKMKAGVMIKEYGCQIIFVDYLQLLHCERKDMQYHEKIDYVAQSLKEISRIYDVPVVALAQLNRTVDKRDEYTLSDLKGSGGIEQNADVVMFLGEHKSESNTESILKIVYAKNRNGITGFFFCVFDKDICRIKDTKVYDESDNYKTA